MRPSRIPWMSIRSLRDGALRVEQHLGFFRIALHERRLGIAVLKRLSGRSSEVGGDEDGSIGRHWDSHDAQAGHDSSDQAIARGWCCHE